MRAFTLVEALVAMAILGVMVTGIVSGFIQSHRTAEWSVTSLAAQSMAMQPVEQTRAAIWDPYRKGGGLDQVPETNYTTTNVLDIPSSGTNIAYATNRVIVRKIDNPVLKVISVDCTWSLRDRVFTNSVLTYRAPDQ